jgi:hypothetical protein
VSTDVLSCPGWLIVNADKARVRHFYAHEYPELLVRDVETMFGKGGGAYGVIEGKDGYENSGRAPL